MFLTLDVFAIAFLALLLDALFGEPDWLWRRAPHPVVAMGRLIDWLEKRLNHADRSFEARRWLGIAALAAQLSAALAIGAGLAWVARLHPAMIAIEVVAVAVLLAQRSLYDHVLAVADGFRTAGLEGGRRAVAMIVGRDPERLDEAGVSRAAIESTAENFSDGVTAPLFWYLVAGLPGIVAYKMLNTADSMVGHRSERYAAYGWASARFDDVANLVPARLSALAITAAALFTGGRAAGAVRAAAVDAHRHRSPNAGWPEAAMAGALGLALAGPRVYAGTVVPDAWMNNGGRREATPEDIRHALRLLIGACVVQGVAVVAAAAWIWAA